jgi:pyridoxal phosphate enzyme (YggS family)
MDFAAKILNQIPSHIKLVAVTKTKSAQTVLNLPPKITDIAENKVQEAKTKFIELDKSSRKFTKHFIGKLQSNKIKWITENFDYIQTVESLDQAIKIDQYSQKANKTTKILLQINISNEPSKQGYIIPSQKEQLFSDLEQIFKLAAIELKGLMTIIKDYGNSKQAKTDFLAMHSLFTELNNSIIESKINSKPLEYLSMGMSNDYKEAIEAGANMLRLGTILFQAPPTKPINQNS